ncbi:MAG: SDR family NAD(P)-dependent oxidoreductase, partial [Bacteroidota bacterium]
MVDHDLRSDTNNEWALILGGSSGLGFAAAKKLALKGYHIIVIHRNRKSDLQKINDKFESITSSKIDFYNYNIDAIHPEKRSELIHRIKRQLGDRGKIKILVHSIAKGNLKPMRSNGENELGNADFHLTIDA